MNVNYAVSDFAPKAHRERRWLRVARRRDFAAKLHRGFTAMAHRDRSVP